MEQKELTYLLQNPASVSRAQTVELQAVLEQYPFFQAARAVMLKGLKNQNSLHYNKELKLTAALTSDRAILFDFISSEEFNQNEIAEQIKKQERKLQEKTSVPESQESSAEEKISLDQALRKKLLEVEKSSETETDNQLAQQDTLNLGQPLQFDRNENHSFTEWLKLTKAVPIEREQSPEENRDRSRKYELIDEFIAKSPKIVPSRSAKKANLAEERLVAPEALMTETLAKVYLEQKNYKKAIQAYKILILKNPEKSGFFADQIRAIEKIQEQNTKE